MKPIDKARELVTRFTMFSYSVNGFRHITELEHDAAKQCALMCAERISQSDWYIPTLEENRKWKKYCNEVKQEINDDRRR